MKKHTKFYTEAKKIRLTASERGALRDRIVSYMEYHPLHSPVVQHTHSAFSLRTLRTYFDIHSFKSRAITGALAVLMVVGIPVAAEQSTPGDILYAVKVQFNEGVRSQFARSPYEKVAWETERVGRRVAEARALAEEGRLTEAYELTLEANVRKHTEAVKDQLAIIRSSDAEGAAVAEVTLESAYDIQTAMLSTRATSSASSLLVQEDTDGLAEIVRAARSEVSSTSSATSSSSYDRLIARVEENTTRIDALTSSLAGTLTEEQHSAIATRTKRVKADLAAAQAAQAAGTTDVSVATLRDALATTEKIIAFMSNGDVRSRLTLDMLIPTKVSDDPRYASLEASLAELVELQTQIVAALETMPEDSITLTIENEMAILAALIGTLQAQLAAGNFDAVEEKLAEADALSTALAGEFSIGTSDEQSLMMTVPSDEATSTITTPLE